MLPKRSKTAAFSAFANTIARPAMKNQPSVTTVAPMAPYSSDARLNRSGRYSWLTACRPVMVRPTSAAPGSSTPGSDVGRGSRVASSRAPTT